MNTPFFTHWEDNTGEDRTVTHYAGGTVPYEMFNWGWHQYAQFPPGDYVCEYCGATWKGEEIHYAKCMTCGSPMTPPARPPHTCEICGKEIPVEGQWQTWPRVNYYVCQECKDVIRKGGMGPEKSTTRLCFRCNEYYYYGDYCPECGYHTDWEELDRTWYQRAFRKLLGVK